MTATTVDSTADAAAVGARPATRDVEDHGAAAGATAMLSLLVGLAPFGLVVGMAAGASDAPAAALAATWLVYSGSAHLAVVSGIDAGSSVVAVVAAGLLINARLLAFSASIAPAVRRQPLRFRLVAAALLVDPLWAVVTGGRGRLGRGYYLGAGLVLWFAWAVAVTTGALLGSQPGLVQLAAVGVPLCLVTIVLPHARTRPGAVGVVTGALAGALTTGWPAGTGVLVGMAAGTAAASLARRSA